MSLRQALVLAVLAAPALAPAATHTVVIEGMKFQPAEITVKRGDKVVWENKDVVPHTATAKGHFDSGPISSGKRFTWVAKAPGSTAYVCAYHPGMQGKVTVK